jgi:hypothetical protein
MRGTALFLILAFLALSFGGCFWLEAAGKAGASGALAVLNAKIPVLSETMKKELEKKLHDGIEKIGLAAADKAHAAGMKSIHWMIRQADLDPMAYDFDGDGELNETEAGIALKDAKGSGKWPWWLAILAPILGLTGTGGAGFTLLKTVSRYREVRRKKEIEVVANGGPKKKA